MDTVIDCDRRHHPLTAGKSVSWRGMFVVERKGAAERVGHAPKHVRPADGGASNL